MLHWGLIPHLAKEEKTKCSMINARAESVATKPAYRTAFRQRRCLVSASGFFPVETDRPRPPALCGAVKGYGSLRLRWPVGTLGRRSSSPASSSSPTPSSQKLAQGTCGGSWEGRCGGMMGGAMPPALGPAQLPEPDVAGAQLLTQYCTQCHGLPNPKQHSASGWPATVARMNMCMQWMSKSNSPMNIKAPTGDELRTLTAYLEKHAADPQATTAPVGQQGPSPVPAGKLAVEILRERYARGEIDREEFLQRLEDLNGR